MSDRKFDVLFLCTGNSARSIIAESLVNRLGRGRFRGHSAGSHPAGSVHPLAQWVLETHGFPTAGLHSKSWEEFERPNAPRMDFVFTVCDNAAAEACPLWPGRPIGAHWGIADPAAASGTDSDRQAAFRRAFDELHYRVGLFVDLPVEAIGRPELEQRLEEIGATVPAASSDRGVDGSS